jgi:hypothetical protein
MGDMNLESVSTAAVESLSELRELWREVGYSKEEAAHEARKLEAALRRFCDDLVSQEEQRITDLRNQLSQLIHDADALRAQLDQPPVGQPAALQDSFSFSDTAGAVSTPLLQAIQVAQGDLEKLHVLREHRIIEFSEVLADLHMIYEKLGDHLPPGYEEIGMDLSPHRLEEIRDKIRLAEEEIEVRKGKAIGLVREIVDYFGLLGYDEEELQKEPFDWRVFDFSIRAKIGDDPELMVGVEDVESSWDEEVSRLLIDFIQTNVIESMEERKKQLEVECERRRDRLRRLAIQITELWDRLNVSQNDRQRFFGEHCGLGSTTIYAVRVQSFSRFSHMIFLSARMNLVDCKS